MFDTWDASPWEKIQDVERKCAMEDTGRHYIFHPGPLTPVFLAPCESRRCMRDGIQALVAEVFETPPPSIKDLSLAESGSHDTFSSDTPNLC